MKNINSDATPITNMYTSVSDTLDRQLRNHGLNPADFQEDEDEVIDMI